MGGCGVEWAIRRNRQAGESLVPLPRLKVGVTPAGFKPSSPSNLLENSTKRAQGPARFPWCVLSERLAPEEQFAPNPEVLAREGAA